MLVGMTSVRSSRAAPMTPEDRRSAILEAVVPLLLAHGDDLTTRQIAEAAGIAEGTIFRVFPDKPALLMAAAERVLNPPQGWSELDAELARCTTLREKVLVAAERLHARTERVMVVMMALRRIWTSQAQRPTHDQDGLHDPRQLFADSHRTLHEALTRMLTPHEGELRVTVSTAATVLRTLVLGSRHPGADPAHRLSPEEIADVLLDGVSARASSEVSR